MRRIKKVFAFALVLAVAFSATVYAFSPSDTPYDDSLFYNQGEYDIHYRVFEAQGERKGRIMLIHGFLCSTYAWQSMAELLSADGYECVLADLPSFGFSTKETADMTHIDRETLIEGLMASIAPLDEWIVAGHSMGGGVAMNIAVDCPQIKALMLFCAAPIPTFSDSRESMMTSKLMNGLLSFGFNVGTRITPLVRLMVYYASADWDFAMNYDVSKLAEPMQLPGTGEGLTQTMYNSRPNDLEAVSALNMPVLIVNAAHDSIISQGMRDLIGGTLPDAVVYNCVTGGHMCIENCAVELSEVTSGFLAG